MILTRFDAIVWRILDASRAEHPLAPATAPEGRFHHHGQAALYASLTAEGAGIAIARYLRPGDPRPRVILPLAAKLSHVWDLRPEPAPERASVVWQGLRAQGYPSPTWAFSDAARQSEAQAMIYLSRSRPDLAHIVLFDWSVAGSLRQVGPPQPWPHASSS